MNDPMRDGPPLAPKPAGMLGLLSLVGLLSCVAGILAFSLVVLLDLPAPYLLLTPAVSLAVAGLLVILARAQWGLCFIAFAICPLGIVQVEVFGVTLGLPEVVILALFVKEGLVFLVRRERVSGALPVKCLCAYLVMAILGVYTGWQQGHGTINILQDFRQFTEFILLFVLAVERVSTPRQVKQILAAYVAGGTILALHGVVERFTDFGIPLNQVLSDAVFHGGTRSGSFYGATPLGGLLVLTVCAAIAIILSTRSKPIRVLLGACVALCVVTIVFTNTRASWVALFFALVVTFCAIRKTPALVATAVIAALVFSVTLGPLVVSRMKKIEFTKAERSLLERVDYYTVAWYIFRDYPLRGLGWGAYYTTSDVLLNKRFIPRPKYEEITPTFAVAESTVHSAYLQLLVKVGVLGLFGFLTIVMQWLYMAAKEWRLRARRETDHNLFIVIAAGLMGYLLHSGLENFFQWPVMAQSFWLFMGLSTVMVHGMVSHRGQIAPPLAPELEPGKA